MEIQWYEVVGRIDGLKALYGEDIPTLADVKMKEIVISGDGPIVFLKFDIAALPKILPVKWKSKGYDTVSIQLDLIEVTHLNLQDLDLSTRCAIHIRKVQDELAVSIVGKSVATITCRWVYLNSISAYRTIIYPFKTD